MSLPPTVMETRCQMSMREASLQRASLWIKSLQSDFICLFFNIIVISKKIMHVVIWVQVWPLIIYCEHVTWLIFWCCTRREHLDDACQSAPAVLATCFHYKLLRNCERRTCSWRGSRLLKKQLRNSTKYNSIMLLRNNKLVYAYCVTMSNFRFYCYLHRLYWLSLCPVWRCIKVSGSESLPYSTSMESTSTSLCIYRRFLPVAER